MLSFEIGQRESGFYSKQTDRITEPSSTVLLYRYVYKYFYLYKFFRTMQGDLRQKTTC